MFIKSAETVLMLALIIATGAFLRKKNIITESGVKLISFLTVFLAMPCNIFVTIVKNYDRASFIKMSTYIYIPFIAMIVLYFVSHLIAKIVKVPKERIGVFAASVSFSNVVLIGFPVAEAVLGIDSLAYSSIYFIANTTLFWSLGVYFIKKDALIINKNPVEKNTVFFKKTIDFLSGIVSPTLRGLIIAVIIIFLNIKVPSFIIRSVNYVAALGTPLAMIYLGAVMYDATKMKFKYTPDTIALLIGRFVLAPMFIFAVIKIFNIASSIITKSFILFSGMACMNLVSIVAGIHGADKHYAAATTVATLSLYPVSLLLYSVYINFL